VKYVRNVTLFRDRLTIQNSYLDSDGQGGSTETWVDGSTIWANIQPMKAYEKLQAMQMQTPVSHKITVRYTTELNPSSRLVSGTRTFWVKEIINDDERGRFLILKAIERVTPPQLIAEDAALAEDSSLILLEDSKTMFMES